MQTLQLSPGCVLDWPGDHRGRPYHAKERS